MAPQPATNPAEQQRLRVSNTVFFAGKNSSLHFGAVGEVRMAVKVVDLSQNYAYGKQALADFRSVVRKLTDARDDPILRGLPGADCVVVPTGVYESDKKAYIAMKYYPDGTLLQLLTDWRNEADPGVPREELIGYMRCVAQGLEYLRALNIPHGDMSPDNVLVSGDRAAVTDFGFDWPPPPADAPDSKPCKLSHAPPEFFGKTFNRRRRTFHGDQYALAVTYAYLRTAQHPFEIEGEDHEALLCRIVRGEPRLDRLPEPEKKAVQQALAVDPGARFSSCVEFVAALEALPPAQPKLSALPRPLQRAQMPLDEDLEIELDTSESPSRPSERPQPNRSRWHPVFGLALALITAAVTSSIIALLVERYTPRAAPDGARFDAQRPSASPSERPGVDRQPVLPPGGDASDPPSGSPASAKRPAPANIPDPSPPPGSLRFADAVWRPRTRTQTNPTIRWSNGADSVSADAAGGLHLAIRKSAAGWTCAEVIAEKAFGYGTYRFELSKADGKLLGEMDQQAVFTFGLGRYAGGHDQRFAFELSDWGIAENGYNGQFAVRREGKDVQHATAQFPARETARIAVEVVWAEAKVACKCSDAETGTVLRDHTFASGPDERLLLPDANTACVRLGLWLAEGKEPMNGKPVEVVVSGYRHTKPAEGK